MSRYSLLIFLGLLALIMPVSAVVIPSNVPINLTNAEVSINNLTFDAIVVSSDTTAFNSGGAWSNLTLSPTDPINVTIYTWNVSGDYKKIWTENSSIYNVQTNHIITGLPPSHVMVYRDGEEYIRATSAADGVLSWMYSGGYGNTREFTVVVDSLLPSTEATDAAQSNTNSTIWGVAVGMMVVLVVVAASVLMFQARKGKLDSGTVISTSVGLVSLCIIVLMGAVILGMF